MAKQSGLHQIRGNVGEHSYYKHTGVESGLIRSINQGMSQRVKTSDEYANTRLNNAEFGQAGRIAKILGRMIVPKYRPMILPFSQSKMAKIVLDAIKVASGDWGQRNLTSSDASVLINALNSVSKNNPSDWGITLENDGSNFVATPDEAIFQAKKEALGVDGVDLTLVNACPWLGTFLPGDQKYAESYARANIYSATITEGDETASFSRDFRPQPPTGWPAFQVDFCVLIILPYRKMNDKFYTMQEHCTFMAVEPPTVPEP